MKPKFSQRRLSNIVGWIKFQLDAVDNNPFFHEGAQHPKQVMLLMSPSMIKDIYKIIKHYSEITEEK